MRRGARRKSTIQALGLWSKQAKRLLKVTPRAPRKGCLVWFRMNKLPLRGKSERRSFRTSLLSSPVCFASMEFDITKNLPL